MHVHELNPWRTLIALSVFVVILIIGFFTIKKPFIKYEQDMSQSLEGLKNDEAYFYPFELDGFLNKETTDIVLFDIRDNFSFGQGHIPGAENISANDLTLVENIKRLKDLKEKNISVVLYAEDQLQANGPWMLFQQIGFDNVKVLLGGYNYYFENKEDLYSTVDDDTFLKGVPKYDFEGIISEMGGGKTIDKTEAKKPVVVRRREKTSAASGGC